MGGGTVYSPWRHVAQLPHITVGIVRLPHGHGWWLPDEQGIALDDRLNRVQRRCVLAHELVHAEAGDQQCAHLGLVGRRQARRRECDADEIAARRLIPIRALADATMAGLNEPELADELDVTVDVLRVRLATLHPAEHGWLTGQVDRCNHTA